MYNERTTGEFKSLFYFTNNEEFVNLFEPEMLEQYKFETRKDFIPKSGPI